MAEHPLSGRSVRVTKLERDPREGFWTARISLGGVTRACDLRHGSWMTTVPSGPGRGEVARKDVLPEYAAVLQEHVLRAEKQEQRIGRDCQGEDASAVPPAPPGSTPLEGSGPDPDGRLDRGSSGSTQPQRKESAMPTATQEDTTAKPAKAGSLMSHIEKALRKAEGPMTAGQLVAAMPKTAFSAKAKAEPFYQVYGRLSAGVKQGKIVKVDKGLFDLAEVNPKGAKKRPAA